MYSKSVRFMGMPILFSGLGNFGARVCGCSLRRAVFLWRFAVAGNDFSPRVLRLARARARDLCEVCGAAGVALQAHHRKYRSRGGDGSLANCLLVCGSGNASGCHGRAHSGVGAELGWSVQALAEPELVAVTTHLYGAVFFRNDGRVLAARGRACWAHAGAAAEGCSWCLPVGSVLNWVD